MNAKNRSYEAEGNKIIKEFTDGWTETESSSVTGAAIIELITKLVRLKNGVMDKPELWPSIDTDTLHKLYAWDSDDPVLQVANKVLRHLAVGQEERAVVMLKAAVQARIDANSRRQAEYTKAREENRGADGELTARIGEIVGRRPLITEREVIEKLESESGGGQLIERIDSEQIILNNKKVVPISALKDRISRAKKKIN